MRKVSRGIEKVGETVVKVKLHHGNPIDSVNLLNDIEPATAKV